MATEAYDRFRGWARAMLHSRSGSNRIYQTSTMGALLEGLFEGDVTVAELLKHGDFGIGTFNHLDGEMVILDGTCYRLRADGSVTVATADDRSPFAAVTWFRPEGMVRFATPVKRDDLFKRIDQALGTTNLPAAVRVQGRFRFIETSRVMAQKPPYPPLRETTDQRAVSTVHDRDGDLVGFRLPEYQQGISVAGYHLHFLTDDRQHGGHALDFELMDGEVRFSTASELHLSLPRTPEFEHANLAPADLAKQIRQSEGG